jgi:hypothetical protein
MGRTTPLRCEIKRIFIPHLVEKGFAVDMRHAPQFFTFRRINPDAVHLCDIQWEKSGCPRFVVNFGVCGAEGLMVRGERIPPQDIFPSHTPDRGRLAQGRWPNDGELVSSRSAPACTARLLIQALLT